MCDIIISQIQAYTQFELMLYLRKLFRPMFSINLDKTFNMKYQVNDVTVIRGLSTDQPYMKLKGRKISLDMKQPIGSVTLPNTGVYDKNTLRPQFLSTNFEIYHPSVPIALVIRQSFYIKWQGNMYCVLNNEPLIKESTNPEYQVTNASSSLQPICRASLQDLKEYNTVTDKAVQNILIKNTMQQALQLKIHKFRHKQLLKLVQQKVQVFQNQISQIRAVLDKQASRRVKTFTTFLVLQASLFHYLIYFHFSWDIMQPITCIMGNIDLFFAYYFFILHGKEFSFGVMHQDAIDAKKNYILKKHGFDDEKYAELIEIRDYLRYRMSFLSKNQHKILDQFQKSFQLLDTR